MKESLGKLKPKIVKVLKENNVARAGIFGSYAKGEANKGSDIDILIEVKGKRFSLIDLIGLEMKLRKITKKKIDLLTYNSLSPYLKESILKEEVKIL